MKIRVFLKENIFLRLAIPLLLGIISADYTFFFIHTNVVFLILFSLITFLVFTKYSFKKRFYFGLVFNIILFLIGFVLYNLQFDEINNTIHRQNKIQILRLEDPKPKSNYFYAKLYNKNNKIFEANVLIEKKNKFELNVNNILIGEFHLKELKTANFYNSFSEKVYYFYNKSIKYKIDLNHSRFSIYKTQNSRPTYLTSISNSIYSITEKGINNVNFAGFQRGLCFGNIDELNKEIKSIFINNGVMHILAVSGLHVGIIFLFFNNFLNLIFKNNKKNKISGVILIFLLIAYAFVCGLNASIIRATITLIFFILSTFFNKDSKIFNLLFLSFFIQIIYNPFYLFQVGFQLSYLAVLSLIIYYPFVDKLYRPKLVFFSYLWATVLSSLIVQIGTLPISLYNFHQFPPYFLISNLICVPASSIILIIGFLKLFLFPFPFLIDTMNAISIFIFDLMMKGITYIDLSPHNQITNIYFDNLSLFLIWIVLILIIPFLFSNLKIKIFYILFFTFLFCLKLIIQNPNFNTTNRLTVFLKSTELIILIEKNKTIEVISTKMGLNYFKKNKPLFFQTNNNYKKKTIAFKSINPESDFHIIFNKTNFYFKKNLMKFNHPPKSYLFYKYGESQLDAFKNTRLVNFHPYVNPFAKNKNVYYLQEQGPYIIEFDYFFYIFTKI